METPDPLPKLHPLLPLITTPHLSALLRNPNRTQTPHTNHNHYATATPTGPKLQAQRAMEEPLVDQSDDAIFAAAPSIDNDSLLIPISSIDESYAAKLQLQEVLLSSFASDIIIVTSHDQRVPDPTVTVILDPKGKQVVETEMPSSSRDGARIVSCGICMEEKATGDFFEIGVCGHEFCEECVGRYVAAKVEENMGRIGCPDVGCREVMEMERCAGLLRPEVFERWGMALCQAMVEDKFYCPYNDCSAMMMVEDDGGEVIRASECPHCNRLFCAQCRVAWHGDIECREFQALGEGERDREDLLLRNVAKVSKWQRCPKCGYFVEKIDGCMFIKCRCGHGFCYSCATPMGADHYCSKCKR